MFLCFFCHTYLHFSIFDQFRQYLDFLDLPIITSLLIHIHGRSCIRSCASEMIPPTFQTCSLIF